MWLIITHNISGLFNFNEVNVIYSVDLYMNNLHKMWEIIGQYLGQPWGQHSYRVDAIRQNIYCKHRYMEHSRHTSAVELRLHGIELNILSYKPNSRAYNVAEKTLNSG